VRRFAELLAGAQVDALVITSALGARILVNGITAFLGRKRGLSAINQTFVVAIGPESARQLEKLRVIVRAIPDRHLLKDAIVLVARRLARS
jgi:uroporphyrinogen-III synthase